MEILIIGCLFSIITASTITYLLHILFARPEIKYVPTFLALILAFYYAYRMLNFRIGEFINLFYIILIIISLSGFISSATIAIYLDYHKFNKKHKLKKVDT